jgi:hypothetical protein
MGFMAIFGAGLIGAVALVATIVASFVKTSRSMKLALIGCWAAFAACVAVVLIDSALCGRWSERGRWNSPDGRYVAVIESEHHGFFASYEVSFRLVIREAGGGKLVHETEETDDVVVEHLWDGPPVNFRWDADSRGGEWTAGRPRPVRLP